MKQLWRISPSAISKACGDEACERKLALDWVTPKGEETEKQKLGVDVHAIQEAYLNTGKAHDRTTRAGKMAMAGLPYMPAPRTGRAEGETELVVSGIKYVIYVDYAGPSDLIPGAPPGMPATLDHKTSSDPDQYGLWGDKAFLSDPQALVYSVRSFILHPAADRTFLRWLYYHTERKSVAKPSDAVLFREDVVRQFGEIVHPAALRLIVLQNECPPKQALAADPELGLAWANTVPYNASVCDKYSGCSHARTGACRVSAIERLAACMSRPNEAKIKYDKPLLAQPGVVTTPAPAGPAGREESNGMAEDLFAKLTAGIPVGNKPANATVAPKAPTASAAVTSKPTDALAALQAAAAGRGKAAKADPVNPPEKPETPPPAKGADLVAHLQSAVAKAEPSQAQTQAAAALDKALSAATKREAELALAAAAKSQGRTPSTPPQAAATKTPSVPPKRPSTPPKAPKTATVEESKAKLDVLLAQPTDEELGRALRVLATFVRSLF